jgi:hypothetical protein
LGVKENVVVLRDMPTLRRRARRWQYVGTGRSRPRVGIGLRRIDI